MSNNRNAVTLNRAVVSWPKGRGGYIIATAPAGHWDDLLAALQQAQGKILNAAT